MTNDERAAKVMEGVEWAYADMERALEHGAWNIALRRAQEVIELTLKGLLALMGFDYPKVHDPARVFARAAQQRGLNIDRKTMAEIQALSHELARKRAPAFYFEIDVSEEEARWAVAGAAKVMRLGQQWKAELLQTEEEMPDHEVTVE